MIIALAGRRIDAEDSEERRFPLEMKDIVYERIKELFYQKDVTVLVSSAACGADLLALKAAKELKIEQHIILPFERGRFRKTSVIDRPGDWGELFDEICDDAERGGNLIVLKGFENDETKAYSVVTAKILDYAKSLQAGEEKVLAVAVWDGKPKNKGDETAAFIEKAEMKNFEVASISTTDENSNVI
jgi:hypothetical protein